MRMSLCDAIVRSIFCVVQVGGLEVDWQPPELALLYLGRRASGGIPFGAMAQLVARFHGMEEVRGSNPLSSTE